jgi:hypothetical protein
MGVSLYIEGSDTVSKSSQRGQGQGQGGLEFCEDNDDDGGGDIVVQRRQGMRCRRHRRVKDSM